MRDFFITITHAALDILALVAEALKVQDVAVAYEINDGYFHIQTSEDGYDYTLSTEEFPWPSIWCR